jgi:hypothetical protein
MMMSLGASIDEYRQSYPSKEVFNAHLHSFSPFVVRQVESLNPTLIAKLAQSDAIVDISCVEKKTSGIPEFKGNLTDREILYMELQKFVGGYIARREGEDHWLFDAELSFYLSQLQIYSGDGKQTIPQSVGSLLSYILSIFNVNIERDMFRLILASNYRIVDVSDKHTGYSIIRADISSEFVDEYRPFDISIALRWKS